MSDNPKVVTEYPRMVDKHETWTESGPVLSHLPDREIALLRERALTTIAEPSPLALWGFATGTWMAATVLGGFLPVAYGFAVAPTLLFFAGIPQFIGGLFAFRRGRTSGCHRIHLLRVLQLRRGRDVAAGLCRCDPGGCRLP